ncbi:ribonuclease H-like domain-containing protein [Tanacetum coccineum]
MASPDQQWYMDTGATSHLSSHTGNLQTSSLNRNFHSVIVGNGSFIPVTHSGHLQIPNPYRPLHLKNVLVTPNIIKNLVSVRKFTTDNKCSIDFDPYGFTVRDYHTRQTLLRCDSTGDLYPLHVAASAFALLTNNHSLWHQRLGHPGDNVIQTLSSRGLVSYNKQNTQHLCRACQLGKQTKLPFQRSTSIVTSPFDIIHSDLWTSPVSSMSGYKYYVLFLDHYSHFLWVYPLHRKSDAQSKLLHFRAFVKTQFNREIKAFQCDHGGEFDNNFVWSTINGMAIMHCTCSGTEGLEGQVLNLRWDRWDKVKRRLRLLVKPYHREVNIQAWENLEKRKAGLEMKRKEDDDTLEPPRPLPLSTLYTLHTLPLRPWVFSVRPLGALVFKGVFA